MRGADLPGHRLATFLVKTPIGTTRCVRGAIRPRSRGDEARQAASKLGRLAHRQESGDNLGPGTPTVHFHQWEKSDTIEVRLLLKGGGCENKNIQYSVPAARSLRTGDRNLDGVRRCILHAVWQAQGHGCSAGAIGVCIGGDRTGGYEHAKAQLFRTLDDVNPNPDLRALEEYVMKAANTLGIGTMGFGGGVTLIGCKVGC
jgi:fumarate hydratase class I